MGWRFRKSFKILPGVNANLGKRGLSGFSFGRGGWFSTNFSFLRGLGNTFSIPGTGLSYRMSSPGGLVLGGVIAIVIVVVLAGLCMVSALIGSLTPPTPPQNNISNTPARSLVSTPNPSPTPRNKKATKGQKNPPPVAPDNLYSQTMPPQTTTGRGGLIRGPRGGCYYINSRGKKTYVDRGLCN